MTGPTNESPDGDSRKVFDVFLSHNSKEKPVVERIAEKLKRDAIEPWLDKWCLTSGGDWQDELALGLRASSACAVFVGPHGIGNWEQLEFKLATDRMAKDRNFRVFLVLLPGLPEPFDTSALPPFLSTRTWVDLRQGVSDPRPYQLLINAIKGLAPGPELPIEPRNDICPYRGLQAFDEEHAEFFFGRDGETQRLIEKLKTTRLLAVLGPSGSGKSSVVRAGLIPLMRKAALADSDTWEVRVFTPGARPLTALAANLVRLYPQSAMSRTLDEMAADQRALHLSVAVALANRPPSECVVWVVDQFEEIFTLCNDETERAQFIANLLYAALIPGGRSLVVLTMRADFYQKCAAYPELSAQVAAQQFLVSPMSIDGLRQAISEPAWRVGLEFEPGLVETILEDVMNQPGATPLLEHALLELWRRRRGRMLTLEAYQESGGVEGAIAKRADTIYESFDVEQRSIARRIMLRLTQPGEGTEDTRRRATLSELITRPDEAEKVQGVVGAMADARLLTTDNSANEQIVDVSHEALIRSWPRLRQWIDEDRQGLRAHRRLTEAAQEWQRINRDESLLFRGARLAQSVEWRERNQAALNDLEKAFLDASVKAQSRERLASQRRTRRIIIGLVAALVLISIASVYALIQSRKAFARELAANAMAQLSVNPELSLLLAIEAAKTAHTIETENALRQALVKSPQHILHVGTSSEVDATFSPDGKFILTRSGHQAQVWESHGGRNLLELKHDNQVASAVFSPDGKLIATTTSSTADESADVLKVWLQFWDAGSGQSVAKWLGQSEMSSLTFTHDGQFLITGTEDGPLTVWALSSLLEGQASQVMALDSKSSIAELEGGRPIFSRDGKFLLTKKSSEEESLVGRVYIWDTTSWRRVQGLPSMTFSYSAEAVGTLSPDGKLVLAQTEDGKLRLYDSSSGRFVRGLEGEQDNPSVLDAVFSPDGKHIATIEGYPRVGYMPRLWDASSGRLEVELPRHQSVVTRMLFSPDSRFLLTIGESAHLNDASTGRVLVELGVANGGGVQGGEFSPDGKFVLTENVDGSVWLWDLSAWSSSVELSAPEVGYGIKATNAVAFSPDGKLVAVIGKDKAILWEPDSGRIFELGGHSDVLNSVAFSPDGQLLLTTSADLTARVWELNSRRTLFDLKHDDEPVSATFSPNGKLIVTASANAARVWDTHDRRLVAEFRDPRKKEAVSGAVFSPDGKSILMVSNNQAQVWDINSKRIVLEFGEQREEIKDFWRAIFSPDGKLIVMGNQVWDAVTGRQLVELRGHSDELTSSSFSPDGKFIVTTGGYFVTRNVPPEGANETRIWDVTSGSAFLEFRGHSLPVVYAVFSPDGKRILTSGWNRPAQIYTCQVCASQDELLKLVSGRNVRPLTPDERVRYLHETPGK